MKLKFILGSMWAGILLASPAFAEVIDKSSWETSVSINEGQIKCESLGSFSGSYANFGEPRSRISLALDAGELSWLPVLRHYDLSLTLDVADCPSLKEIVGGISADGRTPVSITRVLQKVTLPTYGNCTNRRLDEKIELKLKSGKVLKSRAVHSSESQCGLLN